jgi:hypothetical protein
MDHICKNNRILTNPICVPAGVHYMAYAFSGCYALTTPPVLPDGLISIKTAFSDCIAMQYLPEIPSTVTNMEFAFATCKAATKAPSVVPHGVFTMSYAFRNCWNINGTIEINARELTSYDRCFDNACQNSGSIVLTGSCTKLAELAATNALGKVTVATA